MQAVYNTPSVKDFHAAGFLVLYVHTRHTLTIQSAALVPSCVSAVHFHCVPIETKSLVSFKTPQPACLLSVKMQTASISVFKRATIMKKENSLKARNQLWQLLVMLVTVITCTLSKLRLGGSQPNIMHYSQLAGLSQCFEVWEQHARHL